MAAIDPSAHTAGMEILNQEIVTDVMAVLLAPATLLVAVAVGFALVTGLAGRVVLLVEDLDQMGSNRAWKNRKESGS